MEPILLTLAIAAACSVAVAAWLLWRSQASAREKGILENTVQNLTLDVEELSETAATVSDLRVANAELSRDLDAARQTAQKAEAKSEAVERSNEELRIKLHRLEVNETKLITERDAAKARLADAEALEKRGKEWLRGVASEALERETASFLKKIKPLEQKIEDFEKNNARDQGKFEEQIRTLTDTSVTLATALTGNPQKRGRWLEIQVEQILENAGLVEGVSYETQVQVPGGRLDVVLNLPSNKKLIIDPKLSLVSYLQASDPNASPQARAKHLEDLVKSMDKHAEDLAARKYPERLENSATTVFMAVPDEVLQATVSTDPYLLQRHAENNVLIVGFVGLCAAAKAVALSWEQAKMAESAGEVAALGKELHARMTKFAEHLDNARKGLNTAVKYFNKAMGSFRSRLRPAARDLAARGLAIDKGDLAFGGTDEMLGQPINGGSDDQSGGDGFDLGVVVGDESDAQETDLVRASGSGISSTTNLSREADGHPDVLVASESQNGHHAPNNPVQDTEDQPTP